MSKGRGEDAMEAWLRRVLPIAQQDAVVSLSLHPQRSDPHNKSPDFIVLAEITIELFPQQPVMVRVPLLVEVEASGYRAGKDDLFRFIERENRGKNPYGPSIELPFVIATEDGGHAREVYDASQPVRFQIQEIPIPEDR